MRVVIDAFMSIGDFLAGCIALGNLEKPWEF